MITCKSPHCCPTCKQRLSSPILTEYQQLVLDDVRANPGTTCKQVHERLSAIRKMHPTSPQIWMGRLVEVGLVTREKGFSRCYTYTAVYTT